MENRCVKQEVIALLKTVDGEFFLGSNTCQNPQAECPRKDLPSGVGYELCHDTCQQKYHAEIDACLKAGHKAFGSTVYVIGHTYCCDSCKAFMEKSGVKTVIVVDSLATFSDYQKRAWDTAVYPAKGNNLYYPALGLGEAGEIQNKVKKVMRDNNGQITSERREEILEEIGDLLWYAAALATELGADLGSIAKSNIKKLGSRKERGVLQGDGDRR